MIILLHGKDTFRSRQKLKELEVAYQQKHKTGFSFEKIDGFSTDMKQVKNALQSGSLFDSSKLVVLENVSANAGLKGEFADWQGLRSFKGDKDNTIILFENSSVEKDKDYKKIIALADKKQEFKELGVAETARWFFAYYANRSPVSLDIIKEVVSLCRGDMWFIYNELNKIRAYSHGRKITKKTLDAVSVGGAEAQIFPTIDAIFRGDTNKAFYNLLLQWRAGEAPEYVFYMIVRQLKIIAQVKEQKDLGVSPDLIAKKIGEHPFVVKKTLSIVGLFSWPKIKDLYSRVGSLDVKSKTGQIDVYLSCELLSAAVAS
ncbi:MAG: DNA polymerase III subunit delta [Candidatus Spechtbacterales bacterium]